MFDDAIVAVATAAGEAGVGILRFSGPGAVAGASLLFRARDGRPLAAQAPRYLASGRLIGGHGELLDEVLCVRFEAPASYTGEEVAEVHAHGGAYHLRALLQAYLERAAVGGLRLRIARPGEFTQRAFVHGKLDLAKAEAVADLIHSGAALSREVAGRQLGGQLSRELEALRDGLLAVLAQAEAACDMPEIEDQLPPVGAWQSALEAVAARMDALLATARTGQLLEQGLRVALCGAPNAGKSSLMNALLGSERSIVHAEAGTTRDFVEARFQVEGFPMLLVDTAGLRGDAGEVEAEGMRRSQEQVAQSDVCVLLLDQSAAPFRQALEVLDLAPRERLCVLSKADLPPAWEASALPGMPAPALRISARTGEGLEALKAELLRVALQGRGIESLGQALLTRARHERALRSAREFLGHALASLRSSASPDLFAGDLRGALESVGEIVGSTTRAEVVEEIFRRFCVGK
jgi:tRNA modification GTPase